MFSVKTYSKCWLHGIDCLEQLYGNRVGCFIFFFKSTAKMFSCQACGHNCATVLAYVKHMRIHKNTPNSIFKCVLSDCSRSFLRFPAFRHHIYRHGKSVVKHRLCHEVELTCHVHFCREKYNNLKSFYSHLKIHIREGKQLLALIDSVTRDVMFYPRSHLTWVGNIKMVLMNIRLIQ